MMRSYPLQRETAPRNSAPFPKKGTTPDRAALTTSYTTYHPEVGLTRVSEAEGSVPLVAQDPQGIRTVSPLTRMDSVPNALPRQTPDGVRQL